MSATSGLMAGTQIFRDDESSILYANSLLESCHWGLMLTENFLFKLPKRIVDYDCPCSGRPSSCRFTGTDLLHLESPKKVWASVEKNFSHSLISNMGIGALQTIKKVFVSFSIILFHTLAQNTYSPK